MDDMRYYKMYLYARQVAEHALIAHHVLSKGENQTFYSDMMRDEFAKLSALVAKEGTSDE